MDCRTVLLWSLVAVLALMLSLTEGRNKKVVIHVPYKVKKIKHTHTIYKTIHHHHKHHDHEGLHLGSPSEDHEHFHHMHVHDEPPAGAHSQPVPGIGIPDFLPDLPIELPLDIPDVPRDPSHGPARHLIPLFRRV